MTGMERIKLDRDYVKSIIPKTKTIKEMVALCHCSDDKLRSFMRENGLYKEYCEEHNLKYDPTIEKIICAVCGDNTDVHRLKGVAYCKRHYLQMIRHGKIYNSTIYDRNEIIEDHDRAYIVMKTANQQVRGQAIIDIDDIIKIKKYKWYLSAGYCVTKGIDPNNGIDIANVIFDDFDHKYDHINHNKLDDRKINLRPVTTQQNAMNMGKKSTNISGVTGVSKKMTKGGIKWTTIISYNYKSIWLGSHDTFDKAVDARINGEIKYFGEYSPNYNPNTKTVQLHYHSKTDDKDHFIEYSLQGERLQWY